MALFQRFRRNDDANVAPPAPREVLPKVNQRVTVLRAGHPPVPSRVEDEQQGSFVIASPNLALADGERIIVSWESDDGWYSLESTVASIHDDEAVPTVEIASRGRLSRHDDRRTDIRCNVHVPISLRPVITRVVKPGRVLDTHTVELSSKAVRFTTSAPFAPGDLVESSIDLGEGERISARLKVIRVDAATDSWRSVCTAVFDEMLRSDRSQLGLWLESCEDQQAAGRQPAAHVAHPDGAPDVAAVAHAPQQPNPGIVLEDLRPD